MPTELLESPAKAEPFVRFAIAKLEEKGYSLSDGPTPTSSGATIAFVDAPEGDEVELIRRAGPHSAKT